MQEIPSVRLQGMGGVSSGLSEDIASIYTNPSGMGLFIPQELNFSLWPGFIPGSRYQFAGLFLPTRKLNLGLSYLGYTAGEEEIVEFDLSSRKIKVEEDTVFTFSLGKRLDKTEPLFAGMNLKYIHSRLAEDYPATSFTTDWAFLYIKNKIWFAVSIQNLFGKLKYKNIADPLPTTVRIGATYPLQFKNDRFLFALDLVKPNDDEWKQIIGIEYYPVEIPSIRLRTGIGRQSKMNIFGLGFGLKMKKFDLDYAYTGTGEKDNPIRTTLHRISLTMKFGPPLKYLPRVNQAPEIKVITAGQKESTTTVTVTYNVLDADTDTVKVNLFYECQGSTKSSNTTWGEVGLVSTGIVHTLYWDAKKDFNNQETNIRICLLADDLQGGTTGAYSDIFPLDTKPPNGSGLVFAQKPVAGDNSIILQCDWQDPSGSTKNIDTVRFAYRKNNADYTSWIDHSEQEGTLFRILDDKVGTIFGNDYFNRIKSQAVDKYGNLAEPLYYTTEEFVKPAVPNVPEILAVYTSSITLTIIPAEVIITPPELYYTLRATYTLAGIDYEKWVDRDKNLTGLSAVWQSVEPTGWDGSTITVKGLEPGTTYYFSVSAGNPRMGAEPFLDTPPANSTSSYSPIAIVVTGTASPALPIEVPPPPEILPTEKKP
ncbi:MAG TPA: hypothetical protein DHV62_10740 [Elusimicrobia bacterium]|nr:hypothetical protein [Elusimicrobiota bacterium]